MREQSVNKVKYWQRLFFYRRGIDVYHQTFQYGYSFNEAISQGNATSDQSNSDFIFTIDELYPKKSFKVLAFLLVGNKMKPVESLASFCVEDPLAQIKYVRSFSCGSIY